MAIFIPERMGKSKRTTSGGYIWLAIRDFGVCEVVLWWITQEPLSDKYMDRHTRFEIGGQWICFFYQAYDADFMRF